MRYAVYGTRREVDTVCLVIEADSPEAAKVIAEADEREDDNDIESVDLIESSIEWSEVEPA